MTNVELWFTKVTTQDNLQNSSVLTMTLMTTRWISLRIYCSNRLQQCFLRSMKMKTQYLKNRMRMIRKKIRNKIKKKIKKMNSKLIRKRMINKLRKRRTRLAPILIKLVNLNSKASQSTTQYLTELSHKTINHMMTVRFKMTNFEYLIQIYKYIFVLLDLVSEI